MASPYLTIGYYNAFHTKCLKHTFAQIKQDTASADVETLVNFHCYGSVTGEDLHTDVEFCLPQLTPRIELSSQLQVNPFDARSLAMLKVAEDLTRTDYDRKTGGFLGLGDCSGIVYGITGVCHQMCNVIAISVANLNTPSRAPINYPPSFGASYLIYGFRGLITRHIFSFSRLLAEKDAPSEYIQDGYQEILKQFITDLKKFLQQGEPADSKANRYRHMVKTCGTEKVISHLLEADSIFHDVKKEADIQLIRGELGREEYGDTLNGVYHMMMNEFANVLGGNHFGQLFDYDPNDNSSERIIEVELMPPSYEELRKALDI